MTLSRMSLEIGRLTFAPPVTPPARPLAPAVSSAPVAAVAPVARVDTAELSIPPAPPAEVLDHVADAADVARQLARNNRELHFRTDEETGRVVVQVRDLEGNVIRTIPPSEALDVMSGAPIK
jgi:flagellar protein FlaG